MEYEAQPLVYTSILVRFTVFVINLGYPNPANSMHENGNKAHQAKNTKQLFDTCELFYKIKLIVITSL